MVKFQADAQTEILNDPQSRRRQTSRIIISPVTSYLLGTTLFLFAIALPSLALIPTLSQKHARILDSLGAVLNTLLTAYINRHYIRADKTRGVQETQIIRRALGSYKSARFVATAGLGACFNASIVALVLVFFEGAAVRASRLMQALLGPTMAYVICVAQHVVDNGSS
ncbi:hypothetical protein F5Y19DRAFT_486305 [Xylariaceae sp. FL1651]|nr:hypothetical protein F5Y19DRAFT_486305 [Xylariaceae sp. FL1651]